MGESVLTADRILEVAVVVLCSITQPMQRNGQTPASTMPCVKPGVCSPRAWGPACERIEPPYQKRAADQQEILTYCPSADRLASQ